MLQSTFHRLMRGISVDQESQLWRKGIHSWDELEKYSSSQGKLFDEADVGLHRSPFSALREALQSEDVSYFSRALDRREHYRIALSFPSRAIFLDIETTGLSRYYDYVTLVGWCYRGEYGAIIRGDDANSLRNALRDALVIVTFNGSIFDLPFVRQEFPDLPIPPVHLDLRFLAKRVGLSGGQKDLEERLGFKRPLAVQKVKGEAAPLLWHKYRRGDMNALKLLIEYNHSDIEGMKFILDRVVSRLTKADRVPESIKRQIPHFALPTKVKWANDRKSTRHGLSPVELVPYQGANGPAITLEELSSPGAGTQLRVVGIDLTGSEGRPTGWCLLHGDRVDTQMLKTDDEILAATLAARPHLVSIDSPLSLPRGRISVADDDPGREEFGIMRICERTLKKRGVNVYPALIPSMQNLTARGIRLASRFRSLGLPVIESYPGAAQDIMGIPRKRASLKMLSEGLAEFGVRGRYQVAQVTHDELDAITAAVVGVFFWSGRFESLGSGDEEALIIPDLKVNPKPWRERRVIGFSGRIAVGKTTAARDLESRGFRYLRYSMVLEEILRSDGKKVSREALQELGDTVHRELGQRWLGRKLLASVSWERSMVVDGLRFPDDHALLSETFGPAFRHIHIDAPHDVRKQRFEGRDMGVERFARAERHPVEQHVPALRALAHTSIANDGTLEEFASQISELVYQDDRGE